MAIGIGTIATGNMIGTAAGLGLGTSTGYKPGDITKEVINGIGSGLKDIYDSAVTNAHPSQLQTILNTAWGKQAYANAKGIKNDANSIIEHYYKSLESQKEEQPKTKEKTEEESKTPLPPTPNGTEQESAGTPTPEEEQQGNVDKEFQQMLDLAKQEKYENWKREDEIRLETQEREDSAFQRMVKDMRLAGINPNLINATPSASGGGITNATQRENIIGNEIATISNELINAIKNDTTVSNNWKDNAFKTVQSFISLIGSYLIGKGLKK